MSRWTSILIIIYWQYLHTVNNKLWWGKFFFFLAIKKIAALNAGFLFSDWYLISILCEYFFRKNYSKIHVGVLKSGMNRTNSFSCLFFNSIWICTQSKQSFEKGTWQWSAFSLSQWVKGLWVGFTSQPEHCQDNFPYIHANIQSRSRSMLQKRVC